MVAMDGDFARAYVDDFNAAVAAGDFTGLLARFGDDAVIRFENVPGAGVLEFAGRPAFTAAYAEQPPDDQIDITGPVTVAGREVTVPFAWHSTGDPGTMRLSVDGGRIDRMLVRFGEQ